MWRKLVLAVIAAVVAAGAGVYAAFRISPWPSVLLIRYSFDKGGAESAASIAPLVPKGYLQILAARGFVTVAIDYLLAPVARFPTPVRQTNTALAHIVANARRFNIDAERIFPAGDSAGAQIAAQTALVISDASYAQRMG